MKNSKYILLSLLISISVFADYKVFSKPQINNSGSVVNLPIKTKEAYSGCVYNNEVYFRYKYTSYSGAFKNDIYIDGKLIETLNYAPSYGSNGYNFTYSDEYHNYDVYIGNTEIENYEESDGVYIRTRSLCFTEK